MLKAGTIMPGNDDLFARVFWKSPFLSKEGHTFWLAVKDAGTEGMSVKAWREWGGQRGMSVGQFYNMIHGLVGAGMLEKKKGRWQISSGFLRELEQSLILYSAESGLVSRFDIAG